MHFSLKTYPANSPQLVISVSKKVSKSAVVRNTVKRRVRAVFRSLSAIIKPQGYLLIAKKGAEEIKGEELSQEIRRLLATSSKL